MKTEKLNAKKILGILPEYACIGVFIVMMLLGLFKADVFYSSVNMMNILKQGAVLTILCVLGVATALEFKDYQWGGKADWKDWLCTMMGGTVGQVVQLLIVWLLWR